MSFLPKDYSVPSTEGKYMKLQPGENRFRVMGSSIIGFEYWKEEDGKRRPIRKRMDERISPNDLEDGNPPKHFWAFPVFDHSDSKIKILEITQKGIQKSIRAMTKDEDWGDPKEYDIVITREGEGLETQYQVTPKPKKKLDEGIVQMYKDTYINLEALYDGDDPFDESEQLAKDAAEVLGAK